MGRGTKVINFLTPIPKPFQEKGKFVFLSVFIILSLNSSVMAADSEIIHNNYFITKTFGIKTGYLYELQRKKTDKGKKYIITDRHFEQKIKRLNNTIQIIEDTNYIEEESGKPVSFSMNSSSPGNNTKISGKFISDYETSVDSDVNSVKTSKDVKFKDKIIFPYAIDNLYKYPDSKTINYATIEPSIDLRAIKIKTEDQGQENLSADGLNRNYNKYKISVNILPGITSYEWRDRNGQVVKEATSLFKMEQTLSNKSEIADISGDYDMFSGSLIYVDKTITDPESINQLSYKISISVTPEANLFLQDERQKITLQNWSVSRNSDAKTAAMRVPLPLKNNVIYLKINNEKPETQSYSYPVETKGLEEYLKSGPFIMPDSDKISTIAKSLSNGETDAYVISKKMENWVYNYITNKNYSLNFANAVEAFETKSGDCTEHSILLTSLLRAAGIPSKVIVGLIYTDTPKPAFGYHMWVKAYIGNKWTDLDATLPYKNFIPTHIAMAESPLNNISDRADLLINVLKSFSNIKIEILNADKPVISKLDNGILKINFGNAANNDFLTIKTIKNKIKSDDSGIKNIALVEFDEKDYMKSAFYNFIKGDIQKSLNDFNTFYDSISSNDDFSYMQLGLKLSGLGFFNLASKSFDNVKDKSIWGLQIDNTKNIYFPKKKYSPSDEIIISDALSKIKFQNLSDSGIDLIKKNKNKFQNDDYAHYLLAKAYISENKLDFANNELNKAVKINPENLTYRMEQAKIYIQQNNYKSAERELNLVKDMAEKKEIKDLALWQDFNEQTYWLKFKSERRNPLKSKYYKAKYYETETEYNIALELLNSILPGNNDKVSIFETMGNIYLKTNQIDKAKQNFQKALAIDGKNISALIGMGKIYFSEGDNKSALEKYKKALEIEPNNSELKLKTAEIYENLGQEEEASNYYKEVLQDDSLTLEANYNIGMMYLRTGDIDEAEKTLKKALSSDPMHSLIWVDLAGLEITKNNYSQAENYLKPVSYMDEKNSYYYYYSGLINKSKGNLDAAKENFNEALELKPDFDDANQALKRL